MKIRPNVDLDVVTYLQAIYNIQLSATSMLQRYKEYVQMDDADEPRRNAYQAKHLFRALSQIMEQLQLMINVYKGLMPRDEKVAADLKATAKAIKEAQKHLNSHDLDQRLDDAARPSDYWTN